MPEAHRLHHLAELCLGVLAGTLKVLGSQAVGQHLAISLLVKLLARGRRPTACLVKRLCSCLVNEVAIQQNYGGQRHHDGVAMGLQPVGRCLVQVDSQTQGSIIDANQFIVAQEATTDSVHKFLIADGEKFPFANLANTLYLFWCDVDVAVDL